jgi:glycosyltransferase involved in cell wall biosynthesis
MKILHLLYESKGDYFGIGGVGIRAYEIYKRLSERHEITLLCKKYPGAKDGYIEGLSHIFVGTESKNLTKTFLSYAYHAAFFVKNRNDEFDIIVEEFSPAIPTFLHVFSKKPVILQVQGYTGKLYFKKYNPVYAAILYSLERLRPKLYNLFIFMNQETLRKFSFGKSKYVEIISNGVSSDFLDISFDEKDYILYIGRIDIYGKGLDILINAYKEFHESFPHIKLLIAGDGRDTYRFKMLLNELPEDVMKNIKLLGWVSGQGKKDVLKNALFVVFPSRHDVQPIAALEAMASGKAIIVSDTSESSYIIKNRAGMPFKAGNARSLSQSMKDLISSDKRQLMGQRGRDFVKNLTWDRVALNYEEFLYKVKNKTAN